MSWRDSTIIAPASVYHRVSYTERYSRFMVGARNDPRRVRDRHRRHMRRLPCSHASHPWSGELFSSSRIKAYQGTYHSVWVPCTRPHQGETVDGLQPQVCTGSV